MKKIINITIITFFSIIGTGLLIYLLGFRINTTDSIPKGIYKISSSKKLKNAYVIFCPDNREDFKIGLKRGYFNYGHCPSGAETMMKKAVAVSGDRVNSNLLGVWVNDKKLPFSAPKSKDGLNRPLSLWGALNYKIEKNKLMTMTDQDEWSFDSRYYGLINLGQIKGVVIPVWVKAKARKA